MGGGEGYICISWQLRACCQRCMVLMHGPHPKLPRSLMAHQRERERQCQVNLKRCTLIMWTNFVNRPTALVYSCGWQRYVSVHYV